MYILVMGLSRPATELTCTSVLDISYMISIGFYGYNINTIK